MARRGSFSASRGWTSCVVHEELHAVWCKPGVATAISTMTGFANGTTADIYRKLCMHNAFPLRQLMA
jgi:hypothetical protein